MSEAFTQIPGSWNVPGAYTEVQYVPATPDLGMPARILVIAIQQGLTASSALYQDVTADRVAALMGIGASAAICASALQAAAPGVPIDVLAVPPGSGAVKAQWTVTFASAATASGTQGIVVEGQLITFGVASGDSVATMAANFAATWNTGYQARTGLVLTGTNNGVVTLTAVEASQFGNDADIRVSPLSAYQVAGVTVSVSNSTAGAGAPSIAQALATVSGIWYTGIATLLYDTANIQTLAAEGQRRYGAMVKQDARIWVAAKGAYGTLLALAGQINSKFVQILGAQNPKWPLAACVGAFAGVCELSLGQDPALQMRGVTLDALYGMGPEAVDLFTDDERSVLLGSGISTFTVGADGTVALERVVTTCTTYDSGIPLGRPMDIKMTAVPSRVRYEWDSHVESTWPRAKLADDSSALASIPGVVTPRTLLASWVAQNKGFEARGWLQDVDTLAPQASFAIDVNDPNRVNATLPIRPIGALIVDANLLQVQE